MLTSQLGAVVVIWTSVIVLIIVNFVLDQHERPRRCHGLSDTGNRCTHVWDETPSETPVFHSQECGRRYWERLDRERLWHAKQLRMECETAAERTAGQLTLADIQQDTES